MEVQISATLWVLRKTSGAKVSSLVHHVQDGLAQQKNGINLENIVEAKPICAYRKFEPPWCSCMRLGCMYPG